MHGQVGWCQLYLGPGYEWDAVHLASCVAELELHPAGAAEDSCVDPSQQG